MAKNRIRLSLKRDPALFASRVSIGKDRLVYVLVADRKLKYDLGKSRIAYIGTTKKGISRIAQSVAGKAEDILDIHGVRTFTARVITCKRRQKVKSWMKLERAMLLKFREMFGEVPECNSHGSKMKITDEFDYFANSAVKSVIEELS